MEISAGGAQAEVKKGMDADNTRRMGLARPAVTRPAMLIAREHQMRHKGE